MLEYIPVANGCLVHSLFTFARVAGLSTGSGLAVGSSLSVLLFTFSKSPFHTPEPYSASGSELNTKTVSSLFFSTAALGLFVTPYGPTAHPFFRPYPLSSFFFTPLPYTHFYIFFLLSTLLLLLPLPLSLPYSHLTLSFFS